MKTKHEKAIEESLKDIESAMATRGLDNSYNTGHMKGLKDAKAIIIANVAHFDKQEKEFIDALGKAGYDFGKQLIKAVKDLGSVSPSYPSGGINKNQAEMLKNAAYKESLSKWGANYQNKLLNGGVYPECPDVPEDVKEERQGLLTTIEGYKIDLDILMHENKALKSDCKGQSAELYEYEKNRQILKNEICILRNEISTLKKESENKPDKYFVAHRKTLIAILRINILIFLLLLSFVIYFFIK